MGDYTPFGGNYTRSTEWRRIISDVERLSERVCDNPGSVSIEEINRLENRITRYSSNNDGNDLYDVQRTFERLENLKAEVNAFHKTGRRKVDAYSSDPLTLEDVSDWMGDVYGKFFNLILRLFTFLWDLLKKAFGKAKNAVPEYSARAMQNIKTVTRGHPGSYTWPSSHQEPEYSGQSHEPRDLEPSYFDQAQGEGDFSENVPDHNNNPHKGASFGYKSRSQATGDDIRRATEYRNSHSRASFHYSPSYGSEFSSRPSRRESRPQEPEDLVKRRLQNFGLVNGAGVNACFLNSLIQALGCNRTFVAGVEAHEARHRMISGAGNSGSCIMCIMNEIFAAMKKSSASVERLRSTLGLEENRAEDPFEIFERIVNSSDEIKRFFMFIIEDCWDNTNKLAVAMFDIDFVNFFRNNFKDSLTHFLSVLNRTMAGPSISRVEDTLAIYLDTYGPVALRDFGSEVAELCRNPRNRAMFGMRFSLISFVCSQACGNIAHYVTFYYLPAEGVWVYCNDMTVETHSPDSCASKILECNFYPKLLFFKKE